MEPFVVLLALIAGLACRRAGYPPLPGYLFAGFVASGFGLGEIETIEAIADLGLILLLFTIGLKLDIREIATPQIWGVALLQIFIAVPLTTLVIIVAGALFPVMAIQSAVAAWTLALALSFSSTVFAVKAFEERGETNSYHAKLAIGILVIQDIIAVAYLVAASGEVPNVGAFGLLLLPLLRPVLLWLLHMARHGELVLLFGFAVALGGAACFEFVGLKGGLGALVSGIILSNSDKAKELHGNLLQLKDLFLVGFFLQIGYYGLPEGYMWFVAAALSLLIALRPMIYYLLFVAFRLRARTALLGGVSLFTYSEFGLVVGAVAVMNGLLNTEWLTIIALAVTISFVIATPLNSRIHGLYSRYGAMLHRLERRERIPAELPADLGDAEIVVLGMGRVGVGAYERLREHLGDPVVGVDENYGRVLAHREAGYRCVRGDATDYDFWAHSGLKDKKLILVSLANHQENLAVVELAKQVGFDRQLAVVSRYPDQRAEIEAAGCVSFNLYGEAGHGFAEHVIEQTNLPRVGKQVRLSDPGHGQG